MGFLEGDAVCPYFMYDKKGIIQCEMAKIYVRDAEIKKAIGYVLCANANSECPFKKALDNYYERKLK